MTKKWTLKLLIGFCLVAMLAASSLIAACAAPTPTPTPTPPSPPEIEKVKWISQMTVQPGTLPAEGYAQALERLKKMTGGRFEIELNFSNALMSDFDLLDGLSQGTVQFSQCPDAFYSGKEPGLAALFEIPTLFRSPTQVQMWYNEFGGMEIAKEAYVQFGIQHIARNYSPPEPFMSNRPIRSLDDFKGLRLRAVPGMSAMLFETLGASVVSIAFGDIYSGLDTGVIEGAELISLTDNYRMGIHEVTKYFLWPSFHSLAATTAVLVNMDAWNALPEDLQIALETMVQADFNRDYFFPPAANDYETLNLLLNYGLERTTLSPEDWEKAYEIGIQVAEAYKAKSPLSDKIISSYMDYLRIIGEIK